MTDTQLYIAVGVPSFLVILAWLSNNQRFSAQDKRFEQIDRRFEQIDRRFEQIDRRFDDVIGSGHKDALEIMRSMTALHERVAVVETKQS